MKRVAAALLAALFLLTACGGETSSSAPAPPMPGGSTRRGAVQSDEIQFAPLPADAATATIITSEGVIEVVLYPEYAPLAVENFVTLAQHGYYDGTEFHRIISEFVIQGGNAAGTGGESIWGHAFHTERSNYLHHYSGALCMATTDEGADTHQSQFYIVVTPPDNMDEAALQQLRDAGWREAAIDAYAQAGGAPYLDNTDTVFGQVIRGMDVADAIAAVPHNEAGVPQRPVTVESVTVANWPPADDAASQPDAPDTSLPVGDVSDI